MSEAREEEPDLLLGSPPGSPIFINSKLNRNLIKNCVVTDLAAKLV